MLKVLPDKINNLNKKSVLDLFQLSSVSEERFIKKIGEISSRNLEEAKISIKLVFGL